MLLGLQGSWVHFPARAGKNIKGNKGSGAYWVKSNREIKKLGPSKGR